MAKVVAIHSFRRGRGKTWLASNIAVLLASSGLHVGLVDTNFHSPNIHIALGLDERKITKHIKDFIEERCDLQNIVYEISDELGVKFSGKLFMLPLRAEKPTYGSMSEEGINKLIDCLDQFIASKGLDILIIDTSSGIDEIAVSMMAFSDELVVVLMPDKQDFQGTAVAVNIAQELNVPRVILAMNMVPPTYDILKVKEEISKTYNCDVVTVLPYSEEVVMSQVNGVVFSLQFPSHPITTTLMQLSRVLAT